MAVYVDKMRSPYRRMIMCHMFGDTLDELHAMADKIGIKRKWFQNERTPHYDICLSKRAMAVKEGAVEIGHKEAAGIIRKWRATRNPADE